MKHASTLIVPTIRVAVKDGSNYRRRSQNDSPICLDVCRPRFSIQQAEA